MAGSKEDAETVSPFFQDKHAHGLGDPLRVLRVTGFERRQMDTLRRELDQNYEEENDIRKPSADMRQKKLSSIYRT